MAKSKPSTPATSPSTSGSPSAPPAKLVLEVKGNQKYRGARQAWYERLVEFQGKPLAEFVESCTAKAPALYGARSKHAGTPEPVSGWVRYFQRTGVLAEVPVTETK